MAGSGRRGDRLDVVLVARGLAPTRARAQALIRAGRVWSEGRRMDKPGVRVAESTPIEVAEGRRWVGRGAGKLDGVLDLWNVDVSGRDALDVGASTGGFTQVLLERGARRVIALDVGHGQLDWGLRNDSRVHVIENCNARFLDVRALPWIAGVAVVDVSFISLELVLAPVVGALADDGELLALVKPQFEVGRGKVGRGGIVRDPARHREVLLGLGGFVRARDWGLVDVAASPVPGAEGNREFFLRIVRGRRDLGPDELARRVDRVLVRVGGANGHAGAIRE